MCYILNKCDDEVMEVILVSLSIISMMASLYTIVTYPKNKFSSKLVTFLCFSDFMAILFVIAFPSN